MKTISTIINNPTTIKQSIHNQALTYEQGLIYEKSAFLIQYNRTTFGLLGLK